MIYLSFFFEVVGIITTGILFRNFVCAGVGLTMDEIRILNFNALAKRHGMTPDEYAGALHLPINQRPKLKDEVKE